MLRLLRRTYARTAGTRVEPPTRITPSRVVDAPEAPPFGAPWGARPLPSGTPASFSARRLDGPVRSISGRITSSSCARVTVRVLPPKLTSTQSRLVSASFAALAESIASRTRRGVRSVCRPASSDSASARSKSSPPSAESPPTAFTSNTPSTSFRIEMSNVPPPRS